jgi:hypothetical protein
MKSPKATLEDIELKPISDTCSITRKLQIEMDDALEASLGISPTEIQMEELLSLADESPLFGRFPRESDFQQMKMASDKEAKNAFNVLEKIFAIEAQLKTTPVLFPQRFTFSEHDINQALDRHAATATKNKFKR